MLHASGDHLHNLQEPGQVLLDLTPPSTVADKIVQALKEGQEDLIPDVYATQMIAKWNADPKKTEKELANLALAH
ncbi:hypothetical protein ACA910_014641 [Epithemia clementina (nom. ined.)]